MQVVWRPLAPQEIDHEQLWLALAAAALVMLTLTTWHVIEIQLPLCPFKTLTGLPCPSCGVTRAIMAMTRFDLGGAFAMNPLAVLGAFGGALYLGYAAIVLAARLPRFRPRLAARDMTVARVVTVLAISANWVYLVIAGR